MTTPRELAVREREAPANAPAEAAPAASAAAEFEGQGSIRGLVQAAPGVTLPESFAVVVGPSRSVRGREHAASRRLQLDGGQREFELADLPLGGYDVWVEADGLRAPRRAVLLTSGSASPYVILQLGRMGFIDGVVRRADGAPAEGVLVALIPSLGEVRREERTRPDGMYRFDDVEDGEYSLAVGPAEAPLVPPRDLYFRAPSMRFPDVELPPTASLLLFAQDYQGRLMPDVVITGFGDAGGSLSVTTGSDGRARAEDLPPGRWRLQARDPQGTLKARMTFDVTLEEGLECWLVLR
ncbi:MAG: carboxypeptidase regulatory-like domain-containing protein [Planctomycetes bacterium]|nr:carboxypeptidase regulatory-like domain-containing protein [Planctomycetota bacterium]